jgi:hypothetical protein
MKNYFVLSNGSRGEIEEISVVVIEDIEKYLNECLDDWKKVICEGLEGDDLESNLDYIEEFGSVDVNFGNGWSCLCMGEECSRDYIDMESEMFVNWIKRNSLIEKDLIKYLEKLEVKKWYELLRDLV